MDKLFQSVALVQHCEGEQNRLLLRWQVDSNRLEFIVADRLNKESFRESVSREVAWQLDLDRKSDFVVSNMAQLSMEYVESLPDDSRQHVAVAFYNVHLFRRSALGSINVDPKNRWLSASEICEGKSNEGQTIDPRVVAWINKWNVIQPWQ